MNNKLRKKQIGIFIFLFTIFLTNFGFTQKNTTFPTGLLKKTAKIQEEIEQIPFLPVYHSNLRGEKISYIDNSKNKYFPKIFNQIGSSCAQASGVGYIYTYEYNFMMDSSPNNKSNTFNYLYTWNYLNNGIGQGSWTVPGWKIIRDNGIPNLNDFSSSSSTEWVSGYDRYYRGMFNRVKKYYRIAQENLGQMKQYLIDHANGSKVGGLINFGANADPLRAIEYTGVSQTKYKAIIPFFPNTGAHSMVIVGFDDSIEWDFNKNGTIEEDEKGAFIGANSWGSYWGDNGRFYIPYKLITLGSENGGTFRDFYTLVPEKRVPLVTFKVRIKYSSRNDLSFIIGVSENLKSTNPEKKKILLIMDNQGGDLYMVGKRGSKYKEIEIGLDASALMRTLRGKYKLNFFLNIKSITKGDKGLGDIIFCSILDYRRDQNNPIEYIAKKEDFSLKTRKTTSIKICTDIEGMVKSQSYQYISMSANALDKICIYYLDIKTESSVHVQLLNFSGDVVQDILKATLKEGFYSKKINTTELQSGVYFIRIITNNQVMLKKIKL